MSGRGAAADLGPAIRRRRGEVVEEWRAEPDGRGPAVWGGRVRDTLREMHGQGRISTAQWLAAEAFRADAALVAGGRLGALRLVPGGGGGGGGRCWLPGDALVAATGRLRRAYQALGPVNGAVADTVVLGGLTLADAAKRLQRRKAAMHELLVGALDALEGCYAGGPKEQ